MLRMLWCAVFAGKGAVRFERAVTRCVSKCNTVSTDWACVCVDPDVGAAQFGIYSMDASGHAGKCLGVGGKMETVKRALKFRRECRRFF